MASAGRAGVIFGGFIRVCRIKRPLKIANGAKINAENNHQFLTKISFQLHRSRPKDERGYLYICRSQSATPTTACILQENEINETDPSPLYIHRIETLLPIVQC